MILEAHASSRANFYEVSDKQRAEIKRLLTIAKSQAETDAGGRDGAYGSAMIAKRSRFYHACGTAGICVEEARTMWMSYVHDNPAPCEREELI